MAEIKQVVLVGHCGPDSGTLRYAVTRAVGKVAVQAADDAATLERYAGPESLLLVNRVLGGYFASDSGIELIRELAKRPEPPAMMLVSNYADAQEEAVKAGARPGFGKAEAHEAKTAELLKAAISGAKV